jgi:ABC-type branched-subunit amino acid transport system substrate-binding protein
LNRSFSVVALSATLCLMGCPPATSKAAMRREAADAVTAGEAHEALRGAMALYDAQSWADAEKALGRVAATYGDTDDGLQAAFRRGVCLERLGRKADARAAWSAMVKDHPGSPWAKAAQHELGPAVSSQARPVPVIAPDVIAPVSLDGPEVAPFRTAVATYDAGDEASRSAMAKLLDGLSEAQLAALHATGRGGPVQGWLAAKVARVRAKVGDVAGAAKAVEEALASGAGPYEADLRLLAGRLALHEVVKPELVGVVLPLTGKLKAFGEAIRDGILLATADETGVAFDVRDSEGDPAKAADAVESLAKAGAVAIVGPVGLAEAPVAAQRAVEVGVPMISLSRGEGITTAGAWVYRNSLTNAQQGRVLARYVREVLGAKEAATLTPDVPASAEVSSAFQKALEASGGEVRASATYAKDATVFTTPIRQLVTRTNTKSPEQAAALKAAEAEPNEFKRKKMLEKLGAQTRVVGVGFDALLVPDIAKTVGLVAPALAVEDIITQGCDEKAVDLVRRTQKRDSIRTVTLLGTSSWNTPDLVTRGGRYVQCAVLVDGFFADSARPATKAFTEAFVAKYERRPNLLEAQGYDAARLVLDRLQASGAKTRDELRESLAGLTGFDGATGETTFGPDREGDKPLFFLTVDKAGLRELEGVRLSPAGLAAPSKADPKAAVTEP